MTLDEAKKAMVKFVELKTTLRPAFVDPILKAEEVKHGYWSHIGGDEWCCSKCGFVVVTEGSWEHPKERGYDYCYHCGAKMEVEDETD